MTAFLIVYGLTAVVAWLAGMEHAMSPKFAGQPLRRRLLVPVAVAVAWPAALLIGVTLGRRR